MRPILSLAALAVAACVPARLDMTSPPPAGVSHAWVTFDRAALRDRGAGGEADRASGRPASIDDPVRIASVSKIVTALTVMRLVEQGRVTLDEDVSRTLGWRLRNPAFSDRPITLRQLLSHSSSIRDQGDNYVIPLGRTVRSMLEDGQSFDLAHPPGTFFRYSNLNFPVVASVLEMATGERFDRLADQLVLAPLGLDACFNWTTCSDAAIRRAVVLYDDDGSVLLDDLRGTRPSCPVRTEAGGSCDLGSYVPGTNGALFSPQGGLRISMRDLAVIGQLILNQGRHRGRTFLEPGSIAAMVAPAWRFDGANGETDKGFYCAYGLGIQLLPVPVAGCRDALFGAGRKMAGHGGDAYRVRSGLWVDPEKGVGIAFFAANNGTDPPRGRTAYRAVEEWLAGKLRL